MIDLHSHILPGLDDGARDLEMALEMARMYVGDGVETVVCTPHILPGLYMNSGPDIRSAVTHLQTEIDQAGISLRLLPGADNHVTSNFIANLRTGHLLALADSRYVLIEPPHHVLPPRLEELLFELIANGYVPILTHPERLSWLANNYPMMQRLVKGGTWMQLTAGSLLGKFGKTARYWSERMLDDGIVHILATDSHNTLRRPPELSAGRDRAVELLGEAEAQHLVWTRPVGVLNNIDPEKLPAPTRGLIRNDHDKGTPRQNKRVPSDRPVGFLGRLRRFIE